MPLTNPILASYQRRAEAPTGRSSAKDMEGVDRALDIGAEELSAANAARKSTVSAAVAIQRNAASPGSPSAPPTQLGFNPRTQEIVAGGRVMPTDYRTLKQLSEMPNLPTMDALPAGFVPLPQSKLKSVLDSIPVEADKGGAFWAGLKSGTGYAVTGAMRLAGLDVENPYADAAKQNYQGGSLSEQKGLDQGAFDSWTGFQNTAAAGLGSAGPAIIGGAATAIGTGNPVAGLVAGGAIGFGSAAGSQSEDAEAMILSAMSEFSEQQLSEMSPAYRDLRNAKVPHEIAVERVAFEASRVAGGVAGLLTLPETLIGGKLVGNILRKIPGVGNIIGEGTDSAVGAALRRVPGMPALARAADRVPGPLRWAGRTAGRAGAAGVGEGVQELAETGLSQAAGAGYAGFGSMDPRSYLDPRDFEGGFATGVVIGALGGRGRRRPGAQSDLEAALGDPAAMQGSPTVNPGGTDIEGGPLPPVSPTPRQAQDQTLQRQYELVSNVLAERFGPDWDQNIDAIASRPEGRQLIGQLMGIEREMQGGAPDAPAYMRQQPGAPQGDVYAGQPSLQGPAFGDPAALEDQLDAITDQIEQLEDYLGRIPNAMEVAQRDPQVGQAVQRIRELYSAQQRMLLDLQGMASQPGGPGVDPNQAELDAAAGMEDLGGPANQFLGQPGEPDPQSLFGTGVDMMNQPADRAAAGAAAQAFVSDPTGANLDAAGMPISQLQLLPIPMPLEAPADGMGVAPAPLANPEPMSAGEAASRFNSQQARSPEDVVAEQGAAGVAAQAFATGATGANQAAAGTPIGSLPPLDPRNRKRRTVRDGAVSETTPEPAADIAAQIEAAVDPASEKDSVFVADGNEAQIPASLPKGMRRIRREGVGTLLTTNADKATRFRTKKNLTDADLQKLLGYTEGKADVIAAGEPAVAVEAKTASGAVAASQVSTPGGAARARAAARRAAPKAATVETKPVAQALRERAQRKAAEPVELGARGRAVRERARETPKKPAKKPSPKKDDERRDAPEIERAQARAAAPSPASQTSAQELQGVPETTPERVDVSEAARLGKDRTVQVSEKVDLDVPRSLIIETGRGTGPVDLRVQSVNREFQTRLRNALANDSLRTVDRAALEALELRIQQMEARLDVEVAAAEQRLLDRANATPEGAALVERETAEQLDREGAPAPAPGKKAGRPKGSVLYYLPLMRDEMLQFGKAVRAQAKHEAASGEWSEADSVARRLIAELVPQRAKLMQQDPRIAEQLVRTVALLSDTEVIQLVHGARDYLQNSTLAKQVTRGATPVAHVATRGEEQNRDAASMDTTHTLELDAHLATLPPSDAKVQVDPTGLPANAQALVTGWVQMLERQSGPLIGKIHVMTTAQLRERFPKAGSSASSTALGLATRRMVASDGSTHYALGVAWDRLSDRVAMEVLAHEFGHIAGDAVFHASSNTEQFAIMRAFERWRAGNRGKTPLQILQSRAPVLTGMFADAKTVDALPMEYVESFREWTADNVARWLLSNDQPMSVVDKFFAKIAAVMREIYELATGTTRADPAWQKVLDRWVGEQRARAAAPDHFDVTALSEISGEVDAQEDFVGPGPGVVAGRSAARAATQTIRPLREIMGEVLSLAGQGKGEAMRQSMSELGPAVLGTKLADRVQRGLLSLQTLRDIERGYRDTPLGEPLTAWVRLKGMQATTANIAQEPGNNALERANQLTPKARAAMERVMYLGTYYGVNPEVGIDHKSNEHLTKAPDERVVQENQRRYLEARAAYDEMVKLQPTTAEVYLELRDAFAKLHNDTLAQQIENIKDSGLTDAAKDDAIKTIENHRTSVRKGPYFPLMRFGEWIVRVQLPAEAIGPEGSDGYFATRAEAAKEQRAQRSLNPGAKVTIEPTDDGQHLVRVWRSAVYFFESRGEAAAARSRIETEVREAYRAIGVDYDVATGILEEPDTDGEVTPIISEPFGKLDFYSDTKAPPSAFLSEIRSAMKGETMKLDPEVARLLETLYIESLPEFSYRQSLLPRQNILGADKNMLRSYAHRLSGAANRFATVKYGAQVNKAWEQMAEVRKTYQPAAAVVNTLAESQRLLAKRMEPGLLNSALNVITDASSMFSLAFSPAYILMNMAQPWMVTVPVLAGMSTAAGKAVGLSEASRQLRIAYEGTVPFFGKRGVDDFVAELKRLAGAKAEGQTLQESAKELVRKFGKTPSEVAMLDALLDRGTLDFSFLNSLEDAMRGGWVGQKWGALMRMGMALPQQVEAMNRVTTALAAHRIAVKELGYENATPQDWQTIAAFADDIVSQTQLDYSKINRPTMFNRAGFNVILQFKMYMQGMYMLMLRNAWAAIGPQRAGETEAQANWRRRQGARTLGYFFLSHAAVGGAVGITPLTAIPQAMLKLMAVAGLFGDDEDKFKDGATIMEEMFRELAQETLGEDAGESATDVFRRGLPALLGVDVSDRLGLPVLVDTRYMNIRDQDTAGSTMDKAFIYLMGAPYSNAKRVVQGTADAVDGDARWINGLPAGLRAAARAGVYSYDGIVDRDGDKFIGRDELDLRDLTSTAFGIPSLKVQKAYEDRSRRFDTKARIVRERTAILQDWRTADPSERDELRARLREFNDAAPKAFRITPDTLSQSVAAKKARDAGELSAQDQAVEDMLE